MTLLKRPHPKPESLKGGSLPIMDRSVRARKRPRADF
jgi:hypothetical protein